MLKRLVSRKRLRICRYVCAVVLLWRTITCVWMLTDGTLIFRTALGIRGFGRPIFATGEDGLSFWRLRNRSYLDTGWSYRGRSGWEKVERVNTKGNSAVYNLASDKKFDNSNSSQSNRKKREKKKMFCHIVLYIAFWYEKTWEKIISWPYDVQGIFLSKRTYGL